MSTDRISYEDAVAGVLAPWFSGRDLTAGTRIATPKEAAAHGLLAALNVNDGQRGVVRVLVQGPEQKREVINFLTAFLGDEPRLKRLLKRATPDTFFLHGGISIVVDANSARLGKDVVAQIVLDPTANEAIASVWQNTDEPQEQAAVRRGFTVEQVPQLRFIRWLRPGESGIVSPASIFRQAPIEPGPSKDEQGHAAYDDHHTAPDPKLKADLEADRLEVEARYHAAVAQLEAERVRDKLREADRQFARSIA